MVRRVRAAGIALLTLTVSGCFWSSPGANPGRNAHNVFEEEITPETVADLEELWMASEMVGEVGPPVTSNRAVHVLSYSSAGPRVYGIDPGTGAQLWEAPAGVPDMAIVSDPIVAGDAVWVGHGFGSLGGNYVTNLLDPATGEIVGSARGGLVDGVRGSRHLAHSVGWSSSIDSLFALSAAVEDSDAPGTGWSGTIDIGSLGQDRSWPALTLGEENVYQAGSGILAAEDGDFDRGNGIRAYPVDGPKSCPPPIEVVRCPTWATALDGTGATSPVLARDETTALDGTVFTGTDAGTMHAIDAQTGAISWSTDVGAEVGAEPALADGKLYVPAADGRLVVLDAASGDTLWEATAGDALSVQPAVAGGVVFTAAEDGSLHAFDAAGCDGTTCNPLWSASVGSEITGAPAISQGQLYIGTADGRLVAFGLP